MPLETPPWSTPEWADACPEPQPTPRTTQLEPEEKPRQVRKGTRSCWECRRRKIRCKFDEAVSSDVCRGCRRRGAACVGQELSEETSRKRQQDTAQDATGRLRRLESLVGKILDARVESGHPFADKFAAISDAASALLKQDHEASTKKQSLGGQNATIRAPLPASDDHTVTSSNFVGPEPLLKGVGIQADQKLVSITRKLQALLPSPQDCLLIYQLGGYASLCYRDYYTASSKGWQVPGPNYCEEHVSRLMEPLPHPVVLGKRIIGLAATLQRVRHQAGALTEPAALVQSRMAQGVMALVCADDQLIGTLEGLECLSIQAIYFANGGDLRLALLACRRAITVCQLMGLHQPHTAIHAESIEPRASIDPRLLWFKIVYIERMLCLLLGVPDVAVDMNDSGDGEFSSLSICDTDLGQLKRAQIVIASKIIRRNQRDPFFRNSREFTFALDLDLQRTAGFLPPRWWTIPTLSGTDKNEFELFMETNKLLQQLFYNFLLVQLHLPYILRPSSDPDNFASKITCTNAARNALARFVAVRTASDLPSVPEASDFFALIAATALLLVHIDAHRGGTRAMDMSLRHQRQTDRALIMDTLDLMRGSSSRSSEILSKRSADVLKRLLEIEEDAAGGQTYTTSPGPDFTESDEKDEQGRVRDFRLKIPHFGTLIISPDRPVTKAPMGQGVGAGELADVSGPGSFMVMNPPTTMQSFPGQETSGGMLYTGHYDFTVPGGHGPSFGEMSQSDLLGQGVGGENFQPGQENWFPSISASVEDWAFQGVDAVFFDSVMRGLESPSPEEAT